MLKIRHQSKAEAPFNVLSLDSEDSGGRTYVWCVWGHYRDKTINRTFTDKSAVVRFLFHRRWSHTILTGVNLDYDLNTLKYRGGFNWDTIYNMGRLITAYPAPEQRKKYHLDNHALKIIEIGNWILNRSLKQICDDFEIKGHIDKHVLGRDGDEAELFEACMSHAKCGALAFEEVQKQVHLSGGRVKLTASATALDIFMLHHLAPEHQIYDFKGDFPYKLGLPDDATPEEIEAARLGKVHKMKETGGLAYIGGRCEAFNLGLYNDIDGIDLNSSYPYQMRTKIYPDINTCRFMTYSTTELIEAMDSYEGCAHVQIKCPENLRIPLLGIQKDGKLIFPSGTFTGWFVFPELKLALKNGYKIIETYEATVYDRIKGLFDSYIDSMYELKNNPNTKHVGKLLMNGLSGKFGQKTPVDTGFQICSNPPDNVIIDNLKYFLFGDMLYEYIPTDPFLDVEYVHTGYPILSAYILAYARMHLWETMQSIGFEYVKYCDTDSIHADARALRAAVDRGDIKIHKTDLGAWSFDYQHGTIEIRGLKYYRYHEAGEGWHYKIKGVRASEQSNYWLHKCGKSVRVRKIKTAIRSGLRVNEFINVFRKDRLEDPKRSFSRRDSKAFSFFE